jgi:tripartite-type tricarboxylate transporter receptor subunit TctC
MKALFRTIAAALAAGLALAPAALRAQPANFPSAPVKIICDSAPGSANDVTLRLLADKLGAIWGQQVIVVNQPGAGGAISAHAAATATPDGYTLFFPAASTFLQLKGAPGVAENLPLELPRDFAPVAFIMAQPMFIGSSLTLGFKSLPDMIDYARKKPNELSYATTGRGRVTHLTMELLDQRAGVQMQLVPYAGGPAAAMPDVVAGRVGVVLEGYAGLASAMKGHLIESLAVASAQRLPGFENLPTVAETYPGFEAGGWNLIVAPLGTPDPIVRKLAVDINKAIDDKELNEKLNALGAFTRHMTPEQVSAYAQEQQKVWRPILEKVAKETP